jgi:uncharacterized protein (TIGR03790 family)
MNLMSYIVLSSHLRSGLRIFLFALLVAASGSKLHAENSGNDVVVVYNTRVPESKGVAEYYAQRRSVPKDHIFGFSMTTNEEMSRVEFHDALQNALAKALEDNHLWHIGSTIVPATTNKARHVEWRVTQSKIRYLTLCYGIPLRIAEAANIHEEGYENLRPELRRNVAAVDSELAFLPMLESKLPIAGPLRNWTYGVTNTALLHPTNGILMVARLDGPSTAIARGLVDKALEAESNGLWGRAYFDMRNITEPGMKQGDDWIRGAAEICRRLGFETVVDTNAATFPADFPMSQIAVYMGWYAEHACGPFAEPKVEFMPGAFAYHLHSFSADSVRSTTLRWVGPLLTKGATATMGCVAEPYLAGTPDMAVFAARFFYQGFSFGEAACASQSVLSWQTTVVGDPLYRPFGKNPDVQHQEMVQQKSKFADWSWLRLINMNLANGKSAAELVAVLEQLPLRKQSSILSEKLGDLYAEQGKPASSVHAYEEALNLNPTQQQRIRVTLELGEKLRALNKEEEAYDFYVALLKDCPDYRDKRDIVQRLVPLARKLNKNSDVEKYEAQLKSLSVSGK